MQRTALISGISGQDGSYLAELLTSKGYHVVGILRRSTHYHHPNIAHLYGKIQLEYGDVLDEANLTQIIRECQPDEIYHLAAQSVPADSWRQPLVTAEITAVGTLRMLEAARLEAPHARFYQATSREIFGGVAQEVCDEATPTIANNPYGIAKVFAHQMMQTYRESYGMFACGGILFNHESPRRSLHFVTRKITMAAACIALGVSDPPLNELGEPLIQDRRLQLGNLDAVRDWGYAREYVDAMWRMLQCAEPRDFVIATNQCHTVRELCRIAFAAVDLDWQNHVVVDERFLRPTEINAARGDYSAAKAALGWQPETSFEDLIQMMVEADIQLLRKRK
ncbi:MAG: GDP-mannose 4,6-dehydratase [Anaerolineaceae bacterium]|nr:GDP-mannose 4,6-dehydratase [Anaerolineaceae bacterium]